MRDAAGMVWSLAALGGVPERSFLAAAQDALAPRLGAASGLDLANLLWGLAMAGAPLRPAFMDAFTVRTPTPKIQNPEFAKLYALHCHPAAHMYCKTDFLTSSIPQSL